MTVWLARIGRSLGLSFGLSVFVIAACVSTPQASVPTGDPSIATPSPATPSPPASLATPEAVPTEVPEPAAELTLVPTVEGLERPTAVATPDDGTGDLYVVEQAGRILRLPGGSGPVEVALDIRGRVGSKANEQGLLGLAFHPGVADDGRLFVDYTDRNGDTIIAEYELREGRIRERSERVILKVPQPAANHNGGDLHFGPDGMLYISFGDGGGSNGQNAQRRDTLLGKILRLDVTSQPDDGLAYAIPADNPFVGQAGVRPEIWATGLRNPWRFSIESANGALWIGDVGAGEREEVDHAPVSGLDFGWDLMEGTICRGSSDCSDPELVPPVAEYGHDEGCVVTGGQVYAGSAIDELAGRYLLADYCNGRISTLDALLGYSSVQVPEPLLETGRAIVAFGQDADGEVLVVDHAGALLRLSVIP
jgi:glucose/arabinose dehydrogenase